MRIVSAFLGAVALVGLAGCHHSEPGGGPDRAHQFTIDGPTSTTSIRRGETQTVALKLNRGKEFQQTVALKTQDPTGVHATLDQTTIKPSDKADNIALKITATDNAPLGDAKVVVTATPDKGAATTLEVHVKLQEKAGAESGKSGNQNATALSFSGPLTSTSIKQGETRTIDVTLKHADRLNGTAKINSEVVGNDKGIRVEVVNSIVKSNDSGNVGLKVTATKDAALGEHTIRLVATPDNSNVTVTPLEVKVKVEGP
jgi:uncharacterized membrane protein